jgi:transposase
LRMDHTHPARLIPAETLDDAQLRQELADLHRLERAIGEHCLPSQHDALRVRLAELDAEYLRRFPSARESWPWARVEWLPETA